MNGDSVLSKMPFPRVDANQHGAFNAGVVFCLTESWNCYLN